RAGAQLGPMVVTIAEVLLITGIVAATISFHHTVARYMFARGREGVLPEGLGRASTRTVAPRAASLTQIGVGAAGIATSGVGGLGPLVDLFFYAGTDGGLGVLLLVTVTAVAVVVFFARHDHQESRWRSRVAPVAAVVLLVVVSAAGIVNMPELLGTPPGSVLPWAVPAVYLLVALAGVVWGRSLARRRPHVYTTIGLGGRR